jgi:hypothetical protein
MTLNVEALARVQAEILKARGLAAETPDSRLRNALLLLADAAEQKAPRKIDRSPMGKLFRHSLHRGNDRLPIIGLRKESTHRLAWSPDSGSLRIK